MGRGDCTFPPSAPSPGMVDGDRDDDDDEGGDDDDDGVFGPD